MGLACLTEAVNKGCCWLDQTASTFWGKGIGAAWLGWLESKGRLPGIHEHVDQDYFSGFGGGRNSPDGLHSDAFLQKMWCCLERWNLICLLPVSVCPMLLWPSGERVKKTERGVQQCFPQRGKNVWVKWPWVTDCFGWLCIVLPWCCHLGEIRFWRCTVASTGESVRSFGSHAKHIHFPYREYLKFRKNQLK